jgi:hypothetical protein
LKKSTQPGTTTWGSPCSPATVSRDGPVAWMPVGCIELASSESVKSMTPEIAPAAISRSIAGPPTPFAWNTTGACPACSSWVSMRITAGVV